MPISKLPFHTVLCAVIAGCSGAPAAPFAGTWKPTSGMTTLTCNGTTTTQVLPASNTATWAGGDRGTVVLTNQFGSLTASVNDRTATLVAGNGPWLEVFPGTGAISPMTNVPAGTRSGQVQLTNYSFVLNEDGTAATETYTGSAELSDGAGPASSCIVTESAVYERTN